MKSVLFISRKFPPVVGGMENYAFNMHQQFKKSYQVHNIILKKSQAHLIWFYPWIFIYGTYMILFKKIDLVYVGDGVLCSAAWYFEKIWKKKTALTIHGLDVIFDKFGYQKMVKFFLPKNSCIVANSQATREAAISRGVLAQNCHLIPVGIDVADCHLTEKVTAKNLVSKRINTQLDEKVILFTIGRLIKRKGVYWFIDKVVESLPDNHLYLVAGGGKDFSRVSALIKKKQLEHKVFLLGKISDEFKHTLFSMADVFLSPNISIPNDMEGFGIVNLEAGLYGMPVVASAVEGVRDAVISGVTGYLTPEGDADAVQRAIKQAGKFNRKDIKTYVINHFSWEAIFARYEKYFCQV